MKQHITKEQWDELSRRDKFKFWLVISLDCDEMQITLKPNIGTMIEFLGDDFEALDYSDGDWNCYYRLEKEQESKRAKEGVDALWEAVKEKLK